MIESYTEICLASSLIIFPVLYKTSHVFRYYFKYTLYVSFCMTVSLFLMPVLALRPRNVVNLLIGAHCCSPVTPLLGIKYDLRNTQYIAEDKAFIVVSNHQSILDILGLFHLWPIMKKCTVIAKKEVFYIWPFGLAAWLAGLIYIPRSNSEKSKGIMTQAVEMIKQKKTKLWIFPEGKRFSDGEIHPFKKGAFHLALNAQLPILPVVFNQYSFLDHDKKHFDSGTVVMTVLPPISTEGKTLEDLDKLLDETRQKISKTFHEVNKEYKSSKKL